MTAPTRVDMMFRGSGVWRRLARFTLTGGRINVEHEPEGASLVQSMLTEGYRGHGGEPVTAETPKAFMAALLAPHTASYYQFVDASSDDGPPLAGQA